MQILDSNNKPLALKIDPCKQVMSKDVAAATTKVLQAVFDKGGTAEDAKLSGDRPAAGKTGTTDNAYQTWFVGYTPSMVTTVWVGSITSSTKPMQNIKLAGTFYKGVVFGGTLAAPIWKTAMEAMLKGRPVQQFAQPTDAMYDDPTHKDDPNWVNTSSIIEGTNMKPYSGNRSNDYSSSSDYSTSND